MAILKINQRHRSRVQVQCSALGFEVQIYGQPVYRSTSQEDAERVARDLGRALG
jgi:hypothetical protein